MSIGRNSFRIDDILVKSNSGGSVEKADGEERPNEPEMQQSNDAGAGDENHRRPNPTQLMAALSSLYDMAAYLPSFNLLANKSINFQSPLYKQQQQQQHDSLMPLIFNGIHNPAVVAAAMSAAAMTPNSDRALNSSASSSSSSSSSSTSSSSSANSSSIQQFLAHQRIDHASSIDANNNNNNSIDYSKAAASSPMSQFMSFKNTNKSPSSDNEAAAIASSIVAAANKAALHGLQGHHQQHQPKSSMKLCRRRKARTVFSDQQLSGLEKRFESQKYLSTPERVELATSLGLSETQVRKRSRQQQNNYSVELI